MKKTNFFRRVLPLLTLLILSVTSAWGAEITATNPATKQFTDGTYGNKTYLDVANTPTNATISTGSVGVLTYSAYYISHTMKPAWYALKTGSNQYESGGTYSFNNAAANGFLVPASSANGNNAYGCMNLRSTDGYNRYFYITGCAKVAILHKNNTSSKYSQIIIEEVKSDGTMSTVGSTKNTTTTAIEVMEHGSTLDANKYYRVTLKSNNTSNCSLYQIRFTPGEVSTDPYFSAVNQSIGYEARTGLSFPFELNNEVSGGEISVSKISGDFINNVTLNNNAVTYDVEANDSEESAREGVIRLTYTYTEGSEKTIIKDVTITQEKFVKDYVELPFEWEGGSSAEFTGLNGVTVNSLGSDYADSNTPYLIKLDGTGDYIQFKTDSRIGIITIGVKMLGGATSSSIAVTGSADGTNWSETLETLTISGSSNAVLELETENGLAENYRYVRLTFTKGSNIGVGPISIAQYVAPAPRTVTFNGSGKGTLADASLTEAATAAGVTLPTVNNVTAGYQFLGWTATENGTTVDAGLTAGATYKPKKDITLYAVYGKVDYDITNQIEGATVTIKKNGTDVVKANVGDVITLSASKDEYAVSAWDVKDASSNAVTVTDNQFTMPASNVTINATFTESAQSNPAIYRATLTSTTAATVTGSIGGTATLSLQSSDSKYKFGGTSNYITITLPAGQTFNEGDVLNIHTTKAAEANNNKIALFASNSAKADANVLQSQSNFTALGDNKIILNSAFENLNTLTIARTSTYNWNGYVDYVEVTRQPANLTDPTCSATTTAYNPECKAAVEMSVTAGNYVYLQWYSCDAEGNNATAIAGANTASYTYTSTAAEEGTTKYFYCAAVNPKATNKTAKSEVISVAVKMLPRYTITATLPDGGSYTVNAQSVDGDHNSFEAIEGATITMTTTADGTHQLHSTPFVVKDADETAVKVSKSGDNYTFTMPAKAVTVTAQYVATYSITAGSCEHGSVEVSTSRTSKGSKVTVTPTAAEHYHISAVYYVKEGEETHNEISATDDVYSFNMVASNITVYAEFEEDDNVTITWSINGNTDRTSKVYVDEAIVFPSDVDDILGQKFQGWIEESSYSNATTAPTYVTEATAAEAKTYYAVFATAEGNSSTEIINMSATSVTQNGITIAAAKASGNNDPVINGSELRIYASNTITISSDNNITALSLTFHKQGTKDYVGVTANVGDYVSGGESTSGDDDKVDTWTGSSKSIILTAGSTGQRVFVSASVTVGSITYSDYTTTIETSADINISSVGYATFYDEVHAITLPEGVEGYIFSEGAISKVYDATSNVIPAGEPVVLKGSGKITLTYTTTSEDTYKSLGMNDLVGAATDITANDMATANPGDNYFYALSLNKNGEVSSVGFYWIAEEGAPFDLDAGKAYLVLPKDIELAPAHFLFENEEQTATGIENIEANEQAVKFIENGQLIIIKNGVRYNALGQVIR